MLVLAGISINRLIDYGKKGVSMLHALQESQKEQDKVDFKKEAGEKLFQKWQRRWEEDQYGR